MTFLRDLPDAVFFFALLLVVAIAAVLIGAAIWSRRTAHAIATATPVEVGALSPGYRLVWGRTAGPGMKAPLTGRRCVWWRVEVWEQRRRKDSDGDVSYDWQVIRDETSDKPIRLTDGTTLCEVFHTGATVVPSAWSRWEGDDPRPRNREPDLHEGTEPTSGGARVEVMGTHSNRYRYLERYIWDDAPLFALGAALPHGGAGAASDPDPRRPKWAIDRQKGRPFLISTSPPDRLADEMSLAARTALPFGAVFAALAVFMLWSRYGG